MDPNFWHQRWKENDIGFHGSEPHRLLVQHIKSLRLPEGRRIFVPLCGKTRDIGWLLSEGYRLCGAELSEIAVKQLFADLGMKPTVTEAGHLKHYSAENIDIFVGDIFHLSKKLLGPVDAVYDRAALVALPKDMRGRYASHLREITGNAEQLLICYEYDQKLMDGPPFSISGDELKRLYQDFYNLTLVESFDVPGGLKGKAKAKENAWRLKALAVFLFAALFLHFAPAKLLAEPAESVQSAEPADASEVETVILSEDVGELIESVRESSSTLELGQRIVEQAFLYKGTRYRLGGRSERGMDCTGLIAKVWNDLELGSIPARCSELYKLGRSIGPEEVRAGDLIFFKNTYRRGISHVGIYIGNDEIIHASRSRGVAVSKLTDDYYYNHIAGGRRLLK